MGGLVPWPGIEPGPPALECAFLATGPSGKSPTQSNLLALGSPDLLPQGSPTQHTSITFDSFFFFSYLIFCLSNEICGQVDEH